MTQASVAHGSATRRRPATARLSKWDSVAPWTIGAKAFCKLSCLAVTCRLQNIGEYEIQKPPTSILSGAEESVGLRAAYLVYRLDTVGIPYIGYSD
eukprot:6185848-Pleurochrysis_carterae.AAC.1